jgi:hypothetical protein
MNYKKIHKRNSATFLKEPGSGQGGFYMGSQFIFVFICVELDSIPAAARTGKRNMN